MARGVFKGGGHVKMKGEHYRMAHDEIRSGDEFVIVIIR
jgi:hypothetical protein